MDVSKAYDTEWREGLWTRMSTGSGRICQCMQKLACMCVLGGMGGGEVSLALLPSVECMWGIGFRMIVFNGISSREWLSSSINLLTCRLVGIVFLNL